MYPSLRARTERRGRDGFGSGGSREAGWPERRRPNDAEHGLLDDGVAGRNRLADASPLNSGRIVDAWRSIATLSTGCSVGAVDAWRTVGALRARDALCAGRAVGALSAGDALCAKFAVGAVRSLGSVSAWYGLLAQADRKPPQLGCAANSNLRGAHAHGERGLLAAQREGALLQGGELRRHYPSQ